MSSSASLSYLEADAPGDYGGISVGIAPYASGGPFGGFQSNPGTGQSYDITITFSAPVGSVTITALDPTWAGNQMITSGPSGVIDSYSFAYTNRPGYNVPDAHTVTGQITSVHLVAATGEYIAYRMQLGVVPQAAFKVVCASPVDRGESTTCTASPTEPTARLEVVGWSFTSTDPQVAYTNVRGADEDPASTTWSGRMVVSGNVTVKAKVNGGAESEQSAAIAVSARNWTGKPIPAFPVNYIGQGSLPTEPRRDKDLGQILFTGTTFAQVYGAGAIASVPSGGPNAGLVWVVSVPPFVDRADVSANEAALKRLSSFWYGQREHNPNLVFDNNVSCNRTVVTDPATLEKIKIHEGTTFQDKSHSFYFKQAADALLGPAVEGLVATDADFIAKWNAAVSEVWTKASEASDRTDVVAKLNVGCNFNFDYPTRRNP